MLWCLHSALKHHQRRSVEAATVFLFLQLPHTPRVGRALSFYLHARAYVAAEVQRVAVLREGSAVMGGLGPESTDRGSRGSLAGLPDGASTCHAGDESGSAEDTTQSVLSFGGFLLSALALSWAYTSYVRPLL